jgi:hypothetical protein
MENCPQDSGTLPNVLMVSSQNAGFRFPCRLAPVYAVHDVLQIFSPMGLLVLMPGL